MAKNLVKHVLQTDIYNFTKYPYSTGQKFFTSDTNIFHEDIGDYRCAVVPSKLIVTTDTLGTDTTLANNFAIQNNDGTYSIYYYDSGGIPRLISGGSGGWTPPTATAEYQLMEYSGTGTTWRQVSTIRINKIENLKDGGTSYIEFLDASGTPAYEIKINGKTEITDLDFGAW